MPRTATAQKFGEEEVQTLVVAEDEPLHGVKFVQRDIAASFPAPQGAWDVTSVDGYISALVNQGWTLRDTHFAGRRDVEFNGSKVPVFSMIYILEK